MRATRRDFAVVVLGLLLSSALHAHTPSTAQRHPAHIGTASAGRANVAGARASAAAVRAPVYQSAHARAAAPAATPAPGAPLVPAARPAHARIFDGNRSVVMRPAITVPARRPLGSGLSGNAMRPRAPLSARLGGPSSFDARKLVRR